MSKSLIQTVNQSSQTVETNGIVSLGSVLRRFGCNCRLAGNAVVISGEGYYTVDINVSVAPTAAGPVTVALYANGESIPGAVAYGVVSTAENPITLPVQTTIRLGCSATSLTVVLLEGAGTVLNVAVRVEKV